MLKDYYGSMQNLCWVNSLTVSLWWRGHFCRECNVWWCGDKSLNLKKPYKSRFVPKWWYFLINHFLWRFRVHSHVPNCQNVFQEWPLKLIVSRWQHFNGMDYTFFADEIKNMPASCIPASNPSISAPIIPPSFIYWPLYLFRFLSSTQIVSPPAPRLPLLICFSLTVGGLRHHHVVGVGLLGVIAGPGAHGQTDTVRSMLWHEVCVSSVKLCWCNSDRSAHIGCVIIWHTRWVDARKMCLFRHNHKLIGPGFTAYAVLMLFAYMAG